MTITKPDKLTDVLIVIIILSSIAAAIVGIILSALNDIQVSGIAMGLIFTTIIPIILAFFLFRSLARLFD